jgi:hypothetical protein
MTYPAGWPAPGKMHFRLVEPRLGYLDLDCNGGYVVQSYDLGFPEIREVVVPNSLDDGTYDVTRFYGSRAITLDVVLKPHSGLAPSSAPTAPESVLRDRLLAFLHPGLRALLIFSEHGDSRVKQALIRGSQGSAAVDKKNYNKINASWVAPRGNLLSYDERCLLYTFSSNTSDTQTHDLINDGSAPAHWRAVLTGESIKPRFILDKGTDRQRTLQLGYESGVGDVVVIESFSRTVTINGVQTGYKYVDDNSQWFMVPPGVTPLTVEQDTYTVEGYPYAWWQPGDAAHTPTNWAAPQGDPSNNPPPVGMPPWAWTTKADPTTGEPGKLQINFCYYDTYL